MAAKGKKAGRDVTKGYTAKQFCARLRRLADTLEAGRPFVIRIAGERVVIPAGAQLSVEHERAGKEEEVEFQLRWTRG